MHVGGHAGRRAGGQAGMLGRVVTKYLLLHVHVHLNNTTYTCLDTSILGTVLLHVRRYDRQLDIA